VTEGRHRPEGGSWRFLRSARGAVKSGLSGHGVELRGQGRPDRNLELSRRNFVRLCLSEVEKRWQRVQTDEKENPWSRPISTC